MKAAKVNLKRSIGSGAEGVKKSISGYAGRLGQLCGEFGQLGNHGLCRNHSHRGAAIRNVLVEPALRAIDIGAECITVLEEISGAAWATLEIEHLSS